MKSHNVNPQRGENHPRYKQVFDRAELFFSKREPIVEPEPPRKCKAEYRLTDVNNNYLKSSIYIRNK